MNIGKEFNEEEQENINSALARLEHNNIQFVVPRGYQNLPDSVPGSDIDIVVKPDDFENAIETLQEIEFSKAGSPLSRVSSLGRDALENPERSKELLLDDRARIYHLLKNAIFKRPKDPNLAAKYNEFKVKKETVVFHLMNHLAYKSPHNQQKIPVDPEVEKCLHMRSQIHNAIPIPSPPDEAAHLVCRGLFDYGGDFPSYYQDRCDELLEAVFADDEMEGQFKHLLSLLFFDANNIVISCLQDREYDLIRRKLIRYTGY